MKTEKRTYHCFDLRSDGKTIVGKIPYNSPSEDLGYFEILKPGCFARAILKADKIVSLWNHDPGKPLANTKSGTLMLKDTKTSLNVTIKPDPKISWANDALEAVKRGDINGLSFGFEMKDGDKWSGNIREIYEVERLYEISPVVFPAFPESSVAVRNRTKGCNKMRYTREYMNELLQELAEAGPEQRLTIGPEYDRVAMVVDPTAPLYRDVGADAVVRWSKTSTGTDMTPISSSYTRREKRVFESFGEQLKAIIDYGHPDGKKDPRLFSVRAGTGLEESTPSSGGFLLEQPTSSKILENVWNNNEILKRIPKYQLTPNSNQMSFPGLDETSRADGSRWGGIQSYWVGEADEYTATKPKFRKITLVPRKLVGLCYLTDELIADVNALEAYVTKAFMAELDFKIQDSVVNGTGAGQPLGIRNSGAMISISKAAGQSSDTIIFENINSMWSRLFASSRRNAIWLINQNVEPQLHTMSIAVGTGGIACYMPAGGAASSPFSTLFGRPVIPIEQAATLGDPGDCMLCDFVGGGIAVDAGPATSDSSIHVRFVYGEKVLRFQYRFDFQPVLQAPVTPFVGTSTQSHWVQIEART